MHFRSLRFKLTLWYVLILGILLISFSTFLYFTLSKSLRRDVDNKLRSLAELIASESSSPLSKFGFGNIDQALETSMNLKPIGKFIQVLDESGKIGRKSDNLNNVQLPISLNALKNASKGLITYETNRSIRDTPLRIITFPVVDNNYVTKIIQIASSLEEVEDALNTLFIILIITVPLALMVAILGGQFLAHKALKPVDNITQTARMITSQNLNQRITPPKVKDEMSRLIETFNEMISRLDQSFRQVKQFSSDASHELKTPFKILNEVVAQMDMLPKSKRLRLSTSNHHQDIHIFGDALRIRELFINLIENGIKYTEEGGSIHIALQKENELLVGNPSDRMKREKEEFAKIIVSDTGIGIAKEDQEKIFDRFFRVDKARSREQGGSGLGLSICKWIVEAHQGEIKGESEPGKGSSFIVRLPLYSHPGENLDNY